MKTLDEQLKKYIDVNGIIELPKELISYDGRIYLLDIAPRYPDGYVASYWCAFHNDIYAQGDTLKEAKRNLATKVNCLIQEKIVNKEDN